MNRAFHNRENNLTRWVSSTAWLCEAQLMRVGFAFRFQVRFRLPFGALAAGVALQKLLDVRQVVADEPAINELVLVFFRFLSLGFKG